MRSGLGPSTSNAEPLEMDNDVRRGALRRTGVFPIPIWEIPDILAGYICQSNHRHHISEMPALGIGRDAQTLPS